MASTTKRRFECTEGTSNKFWEVAVNDKEVTVRWGRIGTTGQAQTKAFADPAAAGKYADKMIAEKLGKGYEEVK